MRWSRIVLGLLVAAPVLALPLRVGLAATPSVVGDSQDFRRIVNSAREKVFPAVVFIKAIRETHEGGRRQTMDASGSGVLISPKGELLTNWHVIDHAIEVRCLLYDGRAYNAEVIGSDKDTDVALVRLNIPAGEQQPIPYARLGDSSELTEGDFVMAMGAPWGLSRSVSIGIISCPRRFLPGSSEYSLWLQTDASISPGNSGGPLVNTAGEVIGLNARGIMQGGDLGFAIPSATLIELLPQLRKSGKVPWMWTGLQLQPLRDFDRNMYFEGDRGVIVADTEPESPARRAGIQPRDRILSVNGQTVTGMTDEDLPDIRRMLALLPPGEPATIELRRGEQTLHVELIPREKGSSQGEELDCPRWDFTVKTINQFDNPDLFHHRQQGVFVYGIRMPGNAMNSLAQRDIILKIGDQEIRTLDDVKRVHEAALANVEREPRMLLTVLRNGMMRQVVLDFSRDYSRK